MKKKIEERKDVKKTIAKIAKEELFIDTLEQRHRDCLDFHDVSVWGVKKALMEAFKAGIAFRDKQQLKFEKDFAKRAEEERKERMKEYG